MNTIINTIIVLIVSTTFIYAQNESCQCAINGKVVEHDSNRPIPYAEIEVIGSDINTTTDENGVFILSNICTNSSMLITSLGYEDVHHHVKPINDTLYIHLESNHLNLEKVTIEARKNVEVASSSVAQTTIENKNTDISSSLAKSLEEQQGVNIASTGTNIQIPIIHGLYGNRILILNDGVRHGFQNWGNEHAPEIDMSSTQYTTLIKGAGGIQYGPEALGGVIITKSAPVCLNTSQLLTANIQLESNGQAYASTLSTGKGYKRWGYSLGGKYYRSGDRHTPEYSLTNTGKEELATNTKIYFKGKNWDVNANYSFIQQDLALLRASISASSKSFIKAINNDKPNYIESFSYDINAPNQQTQHHLSKIAIKKWIDEHNKLEFIASKQLNQRQEFDVRRNGDRPIIDLTLNTSDYQISWSHFEHLDLEGKIGLHYFGQDNNNNPGTGTTAFIPNYNTYRYSAYIIESLHKGKNIFETGARLDYETNSVRGRQTNQSLFSDKYNFTNLTASFGYVRQFNKNSFRTNIGSAWRTPNVAELYSFGQRGYKTSFGLLRYYQNSAGVFKTDQVLKYDDSNVNAEKSIKLVNELTINTGNHNFITTIYGNLINDYIYERPLGVIGTFRGPMPVFIHDQTDAVFAGIDFSWKHSWHSTLKGTFGTSLIWSKELGSTSSIINQPSNKIDYKLKWSIDKYKKITKPSISVKPKYTFEQINAPKTISPETLAQSTGLNLETEIFDFIDAPKGQLNIDLESSFSVNKFTVNLTVNNLLNNTYRDYLNDMRYFADELGANFILNIKYSL